MSHTFASLIQCCEHLGLCDRIEQLRSNGIKSKDDLQQLTRPALCKLLDKDSVATLWRFLHPETSNTDTPKPASADRRKDFQAAPVTGGTSRKRALSAAQPGNRDTARSAFLRDQYAPSSLQPRQAWWDTWCKIARSWQLQPLPLTVRLVEAAGTSFKQGRYSSAPNYFSRACQEHERTVGTAVPADVRRAIRDATRSIARGLGGTAPKEAFAMEDLALVPATAVLTDAHPDSALAALPMTILGCWFMTREIELSAIQIRDITTDTATKTVSLHLPSQKNDTKAVGCTRTHGCCCQQTRHPLCPYHVTVDHLTVLHDTMPHLDNTAPLFPTRSGNYMHKDRVMQAVRAVAATAGTRTTHTLPDGTVKQRFCGHVMRVAGAQAFARADIPLNIIQLIGRWGSKAVERYVQDAPLAVSHRLALRVTSQLSHAQQPPALADDADDSDDSLPEFLPLPLDDTHAPDPQPPQATALSNGLHIVVNTTSGTAHWTADGPKAEPALSRTLCNWWFGSKPHFHDHSFHRYKPCANIACQAMFAAHTAI
jgi:hypothetical protein